MLFRSATKQLVRNNRIDFFLDAIKGETSVAARRNLLTQLVRSNSVVTALIKSKQIDALLTLCLEGPNDTARRLLLSDLLISPAILGYLVDTQRFEKVVNDVLAETNQARLRSVLQRLLTNSVSVRLLTKHKQMAALIKVIETKLGDNHRKALLDGLTNSRTGLQWLATTGRSEVVISAIGRTASSRRSYRSEERRVGEECRSRRSPSH